MIDDGVRPEIEAPFLRLRPRRGGDDRQPGEAAGDLDQDRAGIEDFVARFEESDIGADGIDDAGGVVAQDLGFALGRGGALADLVVDRIDRDRLPG